MTANCPRCGKTCPVGPHNSAHCTACFTSFRADKPSNCLTREERQHIGNCSGPDSAVTVPFDTGMMHGPSREGSPYPRPLL